MRLSGTGIDNGHRAGIIDSPQSDAHGVAGWDLVDGSEGLVQMNGA